MVKISMFKKNDGALLVIYKTPKRNLIGEVYSDGVVKRGKWVQRATFKFEDQEATEHRVCEYFGFSNATPYWRKWA